MPRLRRSDLDRPGFRRRRVGRGFAYTDTTGAGLTDEAALARIRALVIPPAWQDVWICPWPNGHIQAVGTDARGRRQYRYHDQWRLHQDREKFTRMLRFAKRLPDVRAVCISDMDQDGMPRTKVLACAVRLLDLGFFRIGGEVYAEDNGSYGLATMLKSHVSIHGDEIMFDYPAKSGVHRVQSVADPEVREVVETLRRRRGGGPELLAYRAGHRWIDVRSADINSYLRDAAAVDASAKDFRTWHATVLASVALAVSTGAPTSATGRRRAVRRAVCEVSSYLGNTPTVCRSSYIDPRVIDLYLDGRTIGPALTQLGAGEGPATHGAIEAAVIRLLEQPDRR
jgi:DNA topoisomerase-1